MTSPTGNRKGRIPFRGYSGKRGFSFIEVMVAVAILSIGVVLIYKAFFISLNYLNYLNHRFYAAVLLDNKFIIMQRKVESDKDILVGAKQEKKNMAFGKDTVEVIYDTSLQHIEDLKDLYRLDVSLSWNERGREIKVSRSAYLTANDIIH